MFNVRRSLIPLFVTFLSFLLISSPCSHASKIKTTKPLGAMQLTTFDYHNVKLDDCMWKLQFDETRDAYLRVPNDDLLKGFRLRAGKPAPGVDLGGWYSSDFFHIFGQYISGLSRMYAATGDIACKNKVDALIAGWADCIAPDGYFYYSDKPNATHYVYDKMVCGLLDAYLYCGNKKALTHLSRITDWAIKNLTSRQDEWYTLSENLYRAYLITGDIKYRDFAKKWEYTEYWDHYAKNESIFGKTESSRIFGCYHAYSHVNTLSGAAMAYRVTGDRHYLDVITDAYDYLQNNETYATGGYGPSETLVSPDRLPFKYAPVNESFEVQCGSWAGFKLSKYLISFTGDARYGDWIEKLLINGIGASIPLSPKGEVFYYANYNINGGSKEYTIGQWPCCAGTRPQAIADYYDIIYFKDSDGIYVNLFVPSSAEMMCKGRKIKLIQTTSFPESEAVSLQVNVDKPLDFNIKVRVPGWLKKPMTAYINGQPVKCNINNKHWAEFRRIWHDGDKLEIRFPMGFSLQRFPASSSNPYPSAMMYGPVTLAFRSESNPTGKINLKQPGSDFIPSFGEPLTYHLASDPAVLVRPFYAYKQGEKYYMYLAFDAEIEKLMNPTMKMSPGWGGTERFGASPAKDAYIEYTFEGIGIKMSGYKFDDAGKIEVRIDGDVVDVIDQYAPGRDIPFEWISKSLKPGTHKIRLTNSGEKNLESKGIYINMADLIPIKS